jgi:uncharacterized cupin superfamily protein
MGESPRSRRFNLFAAEVEHDVDDPDGYRGGGVRIGPILGAAMLGATLYELPPQQGIAPYHYEYGNEEWLVVLSGRPLLRHPGGEESLAPGDIICFPVGPQGAHKVSNKSGETVRVLMISTQRAPAVVVYPDSDKIGVWPGNPSDDILARRESAVDYWDREP